MTVREAIREGIKALAYCGIPNAELDAEVLLTTGLRKTREALAAHPETPIRKKDLEVYQDLILRRSRREPVAYLTGHKEFFGLDFFVSPAVLIPRPESELLVEEALNRLPADRPVRIVDIGTGSGCLAVALAHELPKAHILATDLSLDALKVAARNAKRHGVGSRVELVVGNLLDPVAHRHLNCIIANLPYVPEDEVRANPDLQFEPLLALRGQFGPERTLASFLAQWYARTDRPVTILEIHPNQAERVLAENEKIGISVTIKNDLADKPRVAILTHQALREKKTAPGGESAEG